GPAAPRLERVRQGDAGRVRRRRAVHDGRSDELGGRGDDAGSGGAVPLPPAAPSPAGAEDGLRDVDADRPADHRALAAAAPRHLHLGTKTGCRELFAEAGVQFPAGAEDLHSVTDVVDAVVDLHRRRPRAEWAMVKLNEGVSGSGNAVVDLRGLDADSGDGLA